MRLALEIIILAVIPADKDNRQRTANVGAVEIGRIGTLDIDEAAALVAPWARPPKDLALRFFR